ncbi:DUF4396 domain-containing protein [Thiotrichales bacterium 19S3-7]|nr:DUF4396 domain-containing protein [Thiotrichales bacterium 19S3-7]MCF6802155.1 DUF4396 domain-containing protein [Thiotrichales bacterium 19S3-11]
MSLIITIWFVLLIISFIFVLFDSFFRVPISWVQALAWSVVTLYAGVIALIFYFITCRKRDIKTHDEYIKPTYKQAFNSQMHCIAGDATGVIIASVILAGFSMTNGLELIIEYILGFICGLFIFQALMMLPMYNYQYFQAVRKTIFAETVSMNFVMMGMFLIMLILTHIWPQSMNPLSLYFWFKMGMAVVVSMFTAYPINYYLVKRKLKHGCMSIYGVEEEHNLPIRYDHDHHTEHSHHEVGKISFLKQLAWLIVTFAILFVELWIINLYIPVQFL